MAVVYVAPAGDTRPADYYCTGVDDQEIINAAIQFVSSAYSGGTVYLLEGAYSTSDEIVIEHSDVRLTGAGGSASVITNNSFTTVSVSPEPAFIVVAGTALNTIENNVVEGIGLVTTVTGGNPVGIAVRYSRNCQILRNAITGSFGYYIKTAGTDTRISGNRISGTSANTSQFIYAIRSGDTGAVISENNIYDMTTSEGLAGIGIVDGTYCVVSSNTIYTMTQTDVKSSVYGIRVHGSTNTISNNTIHGLSNTAAATQVAGIVVDSTYTDNKVTGNYCQNNGSDTGIANTNGNNFSDAGTDTQIYSNSWQSPVTAEPSVGTFHPHWQNIRSTATATTGINIAISVSSAIPAGATWVQVWGYHVTTGIGNVCNLVHSTLTTQTYVSFARAQSTAVSVAALAGQGMIRLGSTKGFRINIGSTIQTVNIDMLGYWS